jgi:PAS domain S-box-containing protein
MSPAQAPDAAPASSSSVSAPSVKRKGPRTWLGRWLSRLKISSKLAVVISVHLLHALVLLILTTYGLKAIDATRAYVEGEGLWSKAEKDAILNLLVYAETGEQEKYEKFLAEINVTLGDRQARLELEKPNPDMQVVRDGFVQGRNHPDDVENLAWLFRTFRHESHISAAIALWEKGDENITKLLALGEEVRAERSMAQPDPQRMAELVDRILLLNEELTTVEIEFSKTLSEGARFVSTVVVLGTIAFTILFVGGALLISAMVARQVTTSMTQVKTGAVRMAEGEVGAQIYVDGRDEVAAVASAFNTMSRQLAEAMQQRAGEAAAVADSEARFRSLAEASIEGILVHDGEHVLDANPAMNRMFGYEGQEMRGLPILDLVAPESRDEVSRRSRTQSTEAYAVVGLRKDGSKIRLEAVGRALPWQGRVARIVSIRDLTHWQKLESQFRDLLQAAPDAMVIVDARGRIVRVNAEAERLFGYDRQELVGQEVETLVPLDRRDAHRPQREQYSRHPDRRPMGRALDLKARRKDGTEVPVEISLSPLETGEGTRVIATVRDISERRAIEAERRQAQERLLELSRLQEVARFKNQFINTAAHELRTPLMPLRTQVHLMLKSRQHPPDESQRQGLEIMKRNLERLSTLVDDLLTVARSQAGRLGMQIEPIRIAKVVQDACESFQALAKEKGITLEAAVPPQGQGQVTGDAKRLLQVVTNLLSNAFKFTGRGGSVRVSARDLGEEVRVEVADSGAGIASQDIPRLFQPFVQVHDTTQMTEPGSGLGLYICRQFVEMHGGRIGVQSDGLGQGTTFWFTIPKTSETRPGTLAGDEGTWPSLLEAKEPKPSDDTGST